MSQLSLGTMPETRDVIPTALDVWVAQSKHTLGNMVPPDKPLDRCAMQQSAAACLRSAALTMLLNDRHV
jgi:hypothetical protein